MTARARGIFKKKNRISPDVKLLLVAALLYHLGLFYRRVSLAMGLFFVFSYESCAYCGTGGKDWFNPSTAREDS